MTFFYFQINWNEQNIFKNLNLKKEKIIFLID